jgi:hypothetical protein
VLFVMRGAVRVWLCVVVVLAGAGVAGCGGGTDGVVQFGGWALSARSLAHWVAIEAVLSREVYPLQKPPAGVIPDPPRFRVCIAFEREATPRIPGKPVLTPAQLLQACRARYAQVREHIQQLLIGYQWMKAETSEHGIHISEAQVTEAYHRTEHGAPFHSPAEFDRYLSSAGLSTADERTLIRFNLEASTLQEKILHQQGIPGVRRFYQQYPKERAAQTSCSPGYIIPECKQYKGSVPPEA